MLSSETKKAIKSTVLAFRALLEGEFDPDTGEPIPPGGDVARQISRYGILVNKPESFKSENAPEYLTDEEKKKRERICAAIKREVAIFGELSDKAALKRGMRAFIRQTSYTWTNRLLGLRCMEARGLLKDDYGEIDFVVTPSDDYGGLPRRAWRIKGEDPAKWQTAKLYDLQCEAITDACRQLTQEIKVLFDPQHDYGLIWPSAPALNTLLQKIQELDKVAAPGPFTSPDFLGWVYQYFQTIEKDLVFEAVSKKKKKIEKDDIIPATQIYTEHYMVEYLVQNSLGRLWMEMHPDSELSTNWAYYVKPPEENPPVERELKKAIEIKLMDPALGSGHFHLVSFDLLLDMYEEEIENAGKSGWPETPSVEDKKDIPAAILEHNLFGIDIDARSIQLASLVLVMKARESGYEGPINHLNLVVANSAPFESEAWYQFIQTLEKEGKHSVARVLAALGIQLKNLDEFGSLLRIEDEMQKIIQEEKKQWIAQAKAGMEQEYLFPEMTKPKQERLPFETAITDETFFDRLGSVIHKELDAFYLKARQEGLAEEAIMAADAERGFDFARLSLQRYDVVYTNPPFMGSGNMGQSLKNFVNRAYPEGKRDLYTSFILRCRELSKKFGYVGMVSQQSWMFLRSFVDLRALPEKKLTKEKSTFNGLLQEATIETLAHLGAHAFSEISGEVVNVALFTFRNVLPKPSHQLIAFRVIGPKTSEEKDVLLRKVIGCKASKAKSNPKQEDFLGLPNAPIVYWLRHRFFEILKSDVKISELAFMSKGLGTCNDARFVRFWWEVKTGSMRWSDLSKGGKYCKWQGLEYYVVDFEDEGIRIREELDIKFPYLKGNFGLLIHDPDWYRKSGLVYSEVGRGCLGVRFKTAGTVVGHRGPAVYPNNEENGSALAALLNSHLISYLYRSISPTLLLDNNYLGILPGLECIKSSGNSETSTLSSAAERCFAMKYFGISSDPVEAKFQYNRVWLDDIDSLRSSYFVWTSAEESAKALLHTLEGYLESEVFRLFDVKDDDCQAVLEETGIPAGWYPLLTGYDLEKQPPEGLPPLTNEANEYLAAHKRIKLSYGELLALKNSLREVYENGLRGKKIERNPQNEQPENEEALDSLGALLPIPTESLLEELSHKMKLHPISIFWLLEEMREEEGLICPSELRRYVEDYLSVMILLMLGYQWPKQVEAGEPLPDWTDDDGIIPLTDGLGEATLLERIRKRFGADFGEEKEASIESEFANIAGKPLERWIEEDFFARHVKQFKNRPIAWHMVSDPSVVNHEAGQRGKGKKEGSKKKQKPAFSVMVHYHRFADVDKGYGKLLLLKNKYLEKLMSQTRSELESLRGKGDDPETFDRIAELDRKLVELEDFRERLERIQEGKDRESRIFVRWKSSEEQPQGWRPDINDGVRINIAPWERLGMFPVKKIVGKVEMAPE